MMKMVVTVVMLQQLQQQHQVVVLSLYTLVLQLMIGTVLVIQEVLLLTSTMMEVLILKVYQVSGLKTQMVVNYLLDYVQLHQVAQDLCLLLIIIQQHTYGKVHLVMNYVVFMMTMDTMVTMLMV